MLAHLVGLQLADEVHGEVERAGTGKLVDQLLGVVLAHRRQADRDGGLARPRPDDPS